MTIYIDMIFLENFILNFIILYATGLIAKIKINFFRMAIASFVGAIFVIIYYFTKSRMFTNLILKVLLSVVMLYIAFFPKSFKEMLKMIVLFYLTSFVFGGSSLGVIYMVNSGKISIQNGIIIGSYTIKTICIGAIVAFTVIILGFKFIKSKLTKKDLFCSATIKINNGEVKVKAMLDTGNLLKEPITNIPVIIVEHTLLENQVPKEILDNIENILGGDFSGIPENIRNEYISKLRVIPYTSLGKENGMLLGIKADGLIVEQIDNVKNIDKVIIGIYNKKLSKNGEYNALLGIDMV